jgi:hypothetical protein
VTAAKLVLYENLSPCLSQIPMLPLGDWALDSHNDFAAVYDAAAGAVVHFHPTDRGVVSGIFDVAASPETIDYGPIEALMKTTPTDAAVDSLLASLDTAFPLGVAALVTTEPKPTSFQVGADATPVCGQINTLADNISALPNVFPGFKLPVDPGLLSALKCSDPLPIVAKAKGWTWAPQDALADLADGSLSGSRLSAVSTNAVMISPLTFTGDTAEGDVLIAFGKNVAAARSTLASGTQPTPSARQAASEKAGHDALAGAVLPNASLGARVVSVAQRSLVNVYVARDRAAGGIVASVSRQPPYYLDWPRDGSFFSHGLDVAGLGSWVTTRHQWYLGLQRTDSVPPNPVLTPNTTIDPDTQATEFPAYAWEMNYFADGTLGGNIRFEIDNTALHVWSTVVHAATLDGDARASFVKTVWPGTKNALTLLVRWRDPKTGLQWPANEDDHFEITSTLHGATAVYAALTAGARLAVLAGDEAFGQSLVSRSEELRAAVLNAYYDPSTHLFRDTPQTGTDYIPGTTGSGSTAWLAWPARMLDPSDPRLEAQLAADLDAVMKDIRGETDGGAYVMKNVVSAALLGKDGGSRTTAKDAVTRLSNIATPDTMHFGEVFVTTFPNGATSPVFSARVAAPHVWEGMLFYLSAMALSSPDLFDQQLAKLPLPPASAPFTASGSGCHAASADDRSEGLLLAALGLLVALIRLARAHARAGRARARQYGSP